MNSEEKIVSEAANWVIRVEAGLTAADQDAFLEWLASGRRHGAEYERQRANWARLDILADWRPEHAMRPNRDLLAPRKESIFSWLKRRKNVFAGVSLGLAAAAAACVALVLSGPAGDKAESNDAVPYGALADADDTISTIEQSKLDDGTVVELNRGASITVMYSATERYVRINKGEVNFNVAKDPARPFIVNIDGVNVRAVGTSFNVRRENSAVEVLVTSGVVQVHADDDAPAATSKTNTGDALVGAGQMAVVSRETRIPSLTVQTLASEKIENKTAWHPRLLDISERPLSDVVEEFNKRNAPIRLIIADPELANTAVSATLRSDQVENLVRMLEGGFRVKAERTGDTVTLRRDLRI